MVKTGAERVEKREIKREESKKERQFNRIVFKRNEILWGVILSEQVTGKSSVRDTYGHWWVEIGAESYGWWPERGLSGATETIKGVKGFLNGFRNPANVPNSQDLHHGDDADEEFVMIVDKDDSRTPEDIIKIIQTFAKSFYPKPQRELDIGWAYPSRPPEFENCHSFQEKMIKECKFHRKGKTTIRDNKTKEENEKKSKDTPKKVDEIN